MNYRTLKNGRKIEEPNFQTLLSDLQLTEPEATAEDLLAQLNKAKPAPKAPAKKTPAKK